MEFRNIKTLQEAKRIFYWAYKIVRVPGGYIGFISEKEYNNWLSQNMKPLNEIQW